MAIKSNHVFTAKDNTKSAFRSLRSSFAGAASGAATLKAGLVGVVGVGGLAYVAKQSLDAADAIGKTADRLGVSTDALQEYRHAADLSGVATSTLEQSLQRFGRRLGEAENGTGVLAKTIEDNNIQIARMSDGTVDIQGTLGNYADVIAKTTDHTQKMTLANKAFDSEGLKMLNILRGGSAGLREMQEEARAMGLVIDEDLIRGAESANDRLTVLSKSISANLTKSVLQAAPTIESVAGTIIQQIPDAVAWLDRMFDPDAYKLHDLTEKVGELSSEYERLHALGETSEGRTSEQAREYMALGLQLRAAAKELKEFKLAQGGGGEPPPRKIEISKGYQDFYDYPAEEAKKDESLRKQFASLESSLMTEEERLDASYANRQQMLDDAYARNLVSGETYFTAMGKLDDDYAGKKRKHLTDAQRWEVSNGKQRTKFLIDQAIGLTQGLASTNKTAFELNKRASQSNTIMSTYEGATKALAQGGMFGWIQAGAITAAGLANLQAIESTSFGGGASSISAPTSPGTISAPSDLTTSGSTADTGNGSTFNIYLQEDGLVSTGTVQKLIEQINEAGLTGARINARMVA